MHSDPEQTKLIQDAQRIIEDAGEASFVDYAAKKVIWDFRDNEILAVVSKQPDQQATVLQALEATGDVSLMKGYYQPTYAAGKAITNAITALRIEAQTAQQAEATEKAGIIAGKVGYDSLMEYAAAEIPWKHIRGEYTAQYAEQTPESRIVLDALYYQKAVMTGGGHYGKDYTAGAELTKTLSQMDANVTAASSHVQQLRIRNRKEWDRDSDVSPS